MYTAHPQACQRLGRALLAWLWFAGSWAWLSADRLPRDGDEEGHVGAAELFATHLDGGEPGRALAWLGWGDTGDYPGAWPALAGGWWWAVQTATDAVAPGDPGRPSVRAVCLVGLLLAAWATGRAVDQLAVPERARPPPVRAVPGGTVAFAAVLSLPLANGLARHFMPECLLTGAVALALWAALRPPTGGAAVALGVALGFGLLVKQTFALYAIAVVAVAARRMGSRLVFALATAAVIAGPWYLVHFDRQAIYLAGSAVNLGVASWLDHAGYYPLVAATLGLGPVLAAAAVIAAAALARDRAWRPLLIGSLWLLGGILLLALVPKKYPRLLIPLTPAVALWLGAAVRSRRRLWAASGVVALAAAWMGVSSFRTLPSLPITERLDPGCPQHWLRPPVDDDLGLGAVLNAVRIAPPGPVVVIAPPEIPCAVQTTPAWDHHLSPFLERQGAERSVIVRQHRAEATDAAVVVDWSAGAQQRTVEVPLLHGGFELWTKNSR